MLFARDVLKRHAGRARSSSTSSARSAWRRRSAEAGGMPLMWKTGHSLIKAKLQGDRRAAGRRDERPHLLRRTLVRLRRCHLHRGAAAGDPVAQQGSERGAERAADQLQHARAERALRRGRASRAWCRSCASRRSSTARARSITIDGLRAEFADGFGLVRASNTTPVLVLRFEGDTPGGAGAHPGAVHGGAARGQARRADRRRRRIDPAAALRWHAPMTQWLARSRYSTLLRVLTPAYLLRLWWRGRREPLYRHALAERLGFGYRTARRVHCGCMRCRWARPAPPPRWSTRCARSAPGCACC